MREVPIVVFGYDYNCEKTEIGPGTLMRCLEGVRLANHLWYAGERALFLLAAGRAPVIHGRRPRETMAQMMARVIEVATDIPEVFVRQTTPAWGTRGELLSAVQFIINEQLSGYEVDDVYLVSNLTHLWRIRILAYALKYKLGLTWTWHYRACEWDTQVIGDWGLRKQIRELGKIAVELLRIWWWQPKL